METVDRARAEQEASTAQLLGELRQHLNRRRLPEAHTVVATLTGRADLNPDEVEFLGAAQAYLADLAECAHERRCCTEHDTHSTPHIGCFLR